MSKSEFTTLKNYIDAKNTKSINNVEKKDSQLKAQKGVIKASNFTPILQKNYDLSEHDEIFLYNIGDLHLGNVGSNFEKAIRHLKTIKYLPNAFIMIGGDIMDNSNGLGKGDPMQSTMSIMEQQQFVYKLFGDPELKEKILLVLSGNHESGDRTKLTGIDTLFAPASLLGLSDKYANHIAQLNIALHTNLTKDEKAVFSIITRHGSGRSGGEGAIIDQMNRLQNNYSANADMVIQYHTHKGINAIVPSFEKTKSGEFIYKDTNIFSVPSYLNICEYTADGQYEDPNTDNKLVRIRPIENYKLADSNPDNQSSYLPYTFAVDYLSLDRPELVALSKRDDKELELTETEKENINKFVDTLFDKNTAEQSSDCEMGGTM